MYTSYGWSIPEYSNVSNETCTPTIVDPPTYNVLIGPLPTSYPCSIVDPPTYNVLPGPSPIVINITINPSSTPLTISV